MRHVGGTFNLKKGRAVPEVRALLLRVDWLAVQEVRPRARELRRVARRAGFRIHFARDRDSAILVRRGIGISHVRRHSLGGVRWERRPGRAGLHPPRHMVSLRLARRYRVGCIHLPPGPHASPAYPRRRRAMLRAVDRLAVITRRWTRRTPWVLTGDGNQPTDSPILAPIRRDTAAGRGIDWVMGSGVEIGHMEAVDTVLSDHRPRLFTITV